MATTTIERIAAFAAGLRFADLPARLVEKARWQQASVLAAGLAGRFDHAARAVLEAARKHGGQGQSRVLAGGFRSARPTAVLTNGALSCTFDFDEILLLGHPGHSTVNVPLCLGEELGASWADVVTAQLAANEVAGRLGLSTFLGPQNGQMIPHLHCAGAAIATGRLLGLDAGRMAHALAVALSQPPAALWPAFLGGFDAKVLIAAHAAQMGVKAAELAAEGFSGSLDLLDHPRGFFHRFAFLPLPRALGGLGRAWLSDTLQVKLHAACWYYQALIDGINDAAATLTAEQGRPLRAADVKRIRVGVTFLAEAVNGTERLRPRGPLSANEVNFSIPVAVATALLLGRLVPWDLEEAPLRAREHEIRTLAAKIEVRHDAALDRKLLGAMDGALDLRALFGSASLLEIGGALRKARHEFPHASAIRPAELVRALARAPSAVRKLVSGRKSGAKRDYDLGDHDLSSLLLPIPAAFEIELTGGRRLEGSRDIPAGALALPDAPARVTDKLRASATAALGEATATRLTAALTSATPSTPIATLLAALDSP